MKNFKEYPALLIFPVIYVLTDILFRYKHLIYYSGTQLMFYFVSIVFSISLFILAVVLMSKSRNRLIKYTAGILTAFYYTFTTLSSYVFVSSTGIFPNYYTMAFVKN